MQNASLKYTSVSVSNWLFAVAALVFSMIVIGAITRLTESGLSMVEWRPLIGAIPPLSESEWERVFDLYKQSPEYQKKNFWMDIEAFKNIFFWEWFHRFMGRLIGLAYALPFFIFLLAKKIPHGFKLKLFGLLILGGLQGLMGWYMVQSGLVDRPSVSHYRLAAHLALALLILCLLVWQGMAVRGIKIRPAPTLHTHGWVTLGFLILTIFWGAYTAGLDAGLVYNEFPNMGEGWMPPDMWHLSPAWINLFENIPAVQFTHRWLAIFTACFILSLWGHGAYKKQLNWPLNTLAILVFVQVALGIGTLLSGVSIHLAATHQAGAALLLIVMTILLYKTKSSNSA